MQKSLLVYKKADVIVVIGATDITELGLISRHHTGCTGIMIPHVLVQ